MCVCVCVCVAGAVAGAGAGGGGSGGGGGRAGRASGGGGGGGYKLADLGNGCWRDHKFTDDIQTRQYRCPEARRRPRLSPPNAAL